MNLSSILYCHASSRADKPAIEYQGEVISYRALARRVNAFASGLASHGVVKGDRVGLSLKEHPEHLILHYAIARLGAVILPVDHRWTASEKHVAARNFNAKLIITEADDAALTDVKTVPFGDLWPQGQPDKRDDGLCDMPDEDDLPLLVSLSSGTTGKPTGAEVTHRQLYERFVSQWVTIGFNSADRFACLTPLFFGAGRSFGMSFLAAGATVIIDPPPHEPEQIVRAVIESKATATFLVPTMLRRLLPLTEQAADRHGVLFPMLNCLLVSGAALYPNEAAQIRQTLSANLTGYYASSEGGGISVLSADEFAEHGDTVGRATFRTEVDMVDSDGGRVVPGEVGRLRYRGPGVARQFIDSEGLAWPGDKDGWFYPGDLAAMRGSGHIVLHGRDKDMINRGGVNIYPGEVEAVLMQYPGVAEVAVVGRPSADIGEEVVAFIVLSGPSSTRSAGDTTRAALDQHCRRHLAPYKVPAWFVVVEALPRKHSGKIDKQALISEVANEVLHGVLK